MDTHNEPYTHAAQPSTASKGAQGGSVEPANRAPVAIRQFQTPNESPAERYELRDPFADVTYRSDHWPDMVAKADQLGANRFVVLDQRGQRSMAHKVDGQWHREAPRVAEREQPAPPSHAQPSAIGQQTAQTPSAQDPQAEPRIDAQAERAALVARLQASLVDRYIIKRSPVTVGDLSLGLTEYRFRGDTSRVAFTESTFRLSTETNSPSVARSMVDVAEARNWQTLRVTGSEDFRRLVWLEAAARGVKTQGYEPNPVDLERLKVERELRQINRIEPAREAPLNKDASPSDKPSGRGSGGRKAVLAAIEAILLAKEVPEKKRMAIMNAAGEKLAQRIRDGHSLKVKVYDKNAPSQRPAVITPREPQRSRDRAAPAR